MALSHSHSFISSSHLSPEAAGGREARLETNLLQPPVVPGVLRAEKQENLLWFAASMTASPLCQQTVLEENPTVTPDTCLLLHMEGNAGKEHNNAIPHLTYQYQTELTPETKKTCI